MKDFFNFLPISTRQLKVFLGTFLSMFIMVSLQYLGVHFSLWAHIKDFQLVSPLPQKNSVIHSLLPKLEQKKDLFELKSVNNPLLPKTFAATDAENAHAYVVIDLKTGQILAEKNSNEKVAIASLTKLMTAVVSLDLASPDQIFTISQRASNIIPTKIGVIPGQKMTLEELLNGALLTSGNDAAEAIRDGIDSYYGESVFVQAMNAKASFLGLRNSHFTTPQGFDVGDNYSSAEDVAKLTQYALNQYPVISSIVKKDYQFIPANENHKQFDLYNWNGLVDVYPGITGAKIGNTSEAGYTSVVVSNRGGRELAAVILGAPGILQRDLWASELLDGGYEQTLGLAPVNVTVEQLQSKYATWKYFN